MNDFTSTAPTLNQNHFASTAEPEPLHGLPPDENWDEHLPKSGSPDCKLTNDYMFLSVFQHCPNMQRSLLAALLGHRPEELTEIRILNPVPAGGRIDLKMFILDIRVQINNSESVRVELKTASEGRKGGRSIFDLTRYFLAHMNVATPYMNDAFVYLIGILDYSPFSHYNRFYSQYPFGGQKGCAPLPCQTFFHVLDLTQIKNAPQEESDSGLRDWARLLKAATWEDLRMIAQNSGAMQETVKDFYALSQDKTIRSRCEEWDRIQMGRRQIGSLTEGITGTGQMGTG